MIAMEVEVDDGSEMSNCNLMERARGQLSTSLMCESQVYKVLSSYLKST